VRRFGGHLAHSERLSSPIKVAHLTDQHFGAVTSMRIQEFAIALTVAERPDLVMLTGDFVAHSHAYLDQLVAALSVIDAPKFAVLGNHDHWSGAADVRLALARANVCVLDNAHTVVDVRGERLQVVGIDDAYTGHADIERAVKGLDRSLPSIGLSHIAEEADRLWHEGVPLVLSGHTHAGQITVAKLHELAIGKLAGHRYVHGLYGDRRAHGAVYVGAGIGASVMPLRIGERGRRELTIFELGSAPGSIVEDHTEQVALPGRAPTPEQMAKRALAVQKKAAKRTKKANVDRA
jgi:predicted MPP superfamily phosphohydrolase